MTIVLALVGGAILVAVIAGPRVVQLWRTNTPLDTDLWPGGADTTPQQAHDAYVLAGIADATARAEAARTAHPSNGATS